VVFCSVEIRLDAGRWQLRRPVMKRPLIRHCGLQSVPRPGTRVLPVQAVLYVDHHQHHRCHQRILCRYSVGRSPKRDTHMSVDGETEQLPVRAKTFKHGKRRWLRS